MQKQTLDKLEEAFEAVEHDLSRRVAELAAKSTSEQRRRRFETLELLEQRRHAVRRDVAAAVELAPCA